ncbi:MULTISPECIES: acetylglutamate kinase [Moraxella]|nr:MULTISPECIES: acetylglutamate kinase [Moraxella]MCG6815391.1 acetylglutamate kinase [Moraxella catarrhalis]MCG6816733.1 acetylglutamate kinase [Moraxella catarrhalis]MCG6818794.1 acetylglutamate kinase [Moraxella catarrhalis]MDE4519655.1 acetylglutamate kinase [Moraxella catarrhalis]MPW77390.1 acetylglutamate kinase [Moraxella catarrhalis]
MCYVFEVDSVNEEVVDILIASNFIPVIASLGVDVNSDTYNINADLVASRVAKFLGAERLLLLTNIKGVLDKQGRVLTHLSAKDIDHLIADGTISGGMIPKIEGALEAIRSGLHSVTIVDGRVPHACLLEIFTEEGVGTQILCNKSSNPMQ